MEGFSISKIYKEDGEKVVYINPLPEKICSFDCVFCPLGRTERITDEQFHFDETKGFIDKLLNLLDTDEVDIVFLNPDGESLANRELIDVVKLIKNKNKKIKMLTNGYILNDPENKAVLELCDEVIGEFSVTNEKEFQMILRPVEGYTLEGYINNMAEFNKWFKGKFVLALTLLKKYSETEEAISKLKEAIERIKPDEVLFETPDDERLKGAFKIEEEKLEQLRKTILNL